MLIIALLLSCGARQDAAATSPPAAAAPEAAAAAVSQAVPPVDPALLLLRLHMHEHFARAAGARDALIQGDLEATRTALAWLAEHEADPGVPTAWGGWLTAMRGAAGQGRTATDAPTLAEAVAGVATQCGGCHQALGYIPALPHPGPAPTGVSAELPSGEPGVATHMEGHQWAAERMWAGLIAPSGDAWAESLQVLSQPALDTLALEAGAAAADSVATSAYAVHDLAAAGLDDDNPDTRTELYARILTSCAACHAALDGD